MTMSATSPSPLDAVVLGSPTGHDDDVDRAAGDHERLAPADGLTTAQPLEHRVGQPRRRPGMEVIEGRDVPVLVLPSVGQGGAEDGTVAGGVADRDVAPGHLQLAG